MMEAFMLIAAALVSCWAMSGFALAKPRHWKQVMPPHREYSTGHARRLHRLSWLALAVAGLLCLQVDPWPMAILNVLLLFSASAFAPALMLAWEPRWLRLVRPCLVFR